MFYLFPYLLVLSFPSVLLALAAIIPAVILIVRIYRADSREKEPVRLIVKLVFLGMAATFFAILTETLGSYVIDEYSLLGRILMYFIVVALSEEGFKYLLLKKATWKNPEFNYQFDGVVYAVAVSLGFALLENIEYVFSYGLTTALVRAVTAVPGHACFGVFMGTWYGLAKKYENAGDEGRKKRSLAGALIIPVLLHGLYDFIATLQGEWSWVIFLIFVACMFYYSWRLVGRGAAEDTFIG